MHRQNVIQIVPRLPPSIDGVGDYALNLARQLRLAFGTETQFIVGDPEWSASPSIDGFRIGHITSRSASALLSSLPKGRNDSSVVVLHYVGYGYAKRGCPLWLVDGLERWLSGGRGRNLIVMFHEVYASGPCWTSSFWLSPTQRNLAARLVRLSSQIITSRAGYAEILRRLLPGKYRDIPVLPVFSNIGEPDQTPLPLSRRRQRLIVFGNRGHRQLVFKKSLTPLRHTCRALGIEEVFDIGAFVEHDVTQVDNIPVIRTGVQPAHRISALLSDAIVGFFDYPTDYLSKSTIFAAYCAHRLLPVGVYRREQTADDLRNNHHFWLADRYDGEWSLVAGQVVADNAYNWYQDHNLRTQAEVFAAYITAHASARTQVEFLETTV